jgi:MerR family transcriptional regulator, light-induced transcriptional regulator
MPDSLHPIQVVADRTGLSAHVIRIWEKRYEAVTPERTETNRRLYSEEQIERLKLLRSLAESGHGIGYVAKLPTEKLKKLIDDSAGSAASTGVRLNLRATADSHLPNALAAVQALDAQSLGEVLKQAEVELGAQGVLQRLIAPLAQTIGEQWRDGTITAAHEHFATAVLRMFLSHAAKPFAAAASAPVLIAVTPAGQLHELGALLAGATAANLGWQVVYLGASLGAADIAGAAKQNAARAVALSIVYPDDDPHLPAELARLRELLPDTPILAGGRAMSAYRENLDAIGALAVNDLVELGSALDRIRQQRPAAVRRVGHGGTR